MRIITGAVPEQERWRVLTLFLPNTPPGIAWRAGAMLARANDGEILAVVLQGADKSVADLNVAQRTLAQIERASQAENVDVHLLIIEADDVQKALAQLVKEAQVDLLLFQAEDGRVLEASRVPCTTAVVYGPGTAGDVTVSPPIQRILVPTTGGMNTAHTLSLLLPLAPAIEIVALYVGNSDYEGYAERGMVERRMQRLLNYVGAAERIQTQIVFANSPAQGLQQKAAAYDLVIMGVSQAQPPDHVWFGEPAQEVARQTGRPIAMVQQPPDLFKQLLRQIDWTVQRVIPRLGPEEREQTQERISSSARPSLDFFTLIILSTAIASFGLLIDSGAVVIGAMLVAPLMSPIVGTGMSIVLGDTHFLRLSLGTVLRGVVLAILVGFLSGLLQLEQPLTGEILARTQPSLFDLGVALFSGLAGAYALSRSDAAGALPGVAIAAALVPPLATVGISFATGHWPQGLGALLLFITNFVAISFATAFVFLILGFRPAVGQKLERVIQVRTFRIAFVLLLLVGVILFVTTYNLAAALAFEARVREVTRTQVADLCATIGYDETPLDCSTSLADLTIDGPLDDPAEPLELEVLARSTQLVPHQAVIDLQKQISIELQRPITLTLTVIRVTELNPIVPPTLTPTPSATNTGTPDPTATPTPTYTPTSTSTPTPTATSMPTETPTSTPTSTPTQTPAPTQTPTPTPRTAVIVYPYGLNLRAGPTTASESLGLLAENTVVILLEGQETADGYEWQQVRADGQVGWVARQFLDISPPTIPKGTPTP